MSAPADLPMVLRVPEGPLDSAPVTKWAPACAIGGAAALLLLLSASPAAATTEEVESPVVLVGLGGLSWSDIDTGTTPAVASFVSTAALGHLSVRSVNRVTCPVDAWLTLSASRRAAAERIPGADESDNTTELNTFCPPIPPVRDGEVEGWQKLAEYNAELSFNAPLGLLGSSAAADGVSVLAAGSGAAVGAAETDGNVPDYLPDPGALTAEVIGNHDLTLVDLGAVDERAADAQPRLLQVQRLDGEFSRLLAEVPESATVLLVAGSNARPTAELQVVAARGPSYPRGLLTSASTKQDGLILLTDLTPTLFDLTGMAPAPEFVGAPIVSVPSGSSWQALQLRLVDQARKVEVYTEVAQPFFTALVPLQIALYAGAAWAFRRRADKPAARRIILRVTAWVALTCSSIPVASFLANMVPWWTWSSPHTGLVVLVLAWALAVAAVARLLGRNHDLLTEVGVVAAATAGVLAVDVAIGGPLQTASLMGYSPVIAGRLYGFGNVAFALFATGLVFSAAWIGDVVHRRGHRRAAAGLVLGFGLLGVVIDGLPQLGSDFGGIIAITCGFGVFLLGVLQLRLTAARLLAVAGVALALVTLVSVVDWRRPAEERSHLGAFVQQVLDGEFANIVGRKLANNLDILFSSVLGLLVPFAVLFLAFVLLRPLRQTPAVLTIAYQEAPMLRPAFMGWVTLMVVGFAVNDSGVAIPAVGIMMTIPFLILISLKVLAHQIQDSDAALTPGGTSLD